MRKRHLVVGVVMLVATVVSYQSYELVQFTGTSLAAAGEDRKLSPSTVGIHAAVVPRVMPPQAPPDARMLAPISDAVLLGATGAALFVIAAGVKRRAG